MLLAAVLVAVLHAAVVAFLLGGSLFALRWPRLLWLHAPVALTIVVLYLTDAGCPLTSWELDLRESAGESRYGGGFIGHYVTEPLGFPIEATTTQVGIHLVAFLANALGYGLLAARHRRQGPQGTGRSDQRSRESSPAKSSLRHHSTIRPPSIR